FKQINQKQGAQSVPNSGGGKTLAPKKFWAVQVAMSELNAGQWQPKYVYDQKFYLDIEDPPSAFMLKANQQPNFDLQIQLYYTGSDYQTDDYALYIGEATLPLPGGILSVTQRDFFLPYGLDIDLTQEPSFSLVKSVPLLLNGSLTIDPTP